MIATQSYETFFRATPQQVWDAITRPEHTERYFFGTRVSLDARPGGKIEYRMADGALMVDGDVKRVTPGSELTHTWRVHYDPSAQGEVSTVTWRIERRGDATKLTAIHELAEAPNTARNVGTDGWSVVLSSMKTLVETGQPLVIGQPG